MLLELVRLAASDGDVSTWGRTRQEEGSETASQHFLPQLPVRDSWRNQAAAAWLCGRAQSEKCVRGECGSSQCLTNCILGALKLPVFHGETPLPKGLAAAMPADKVEAHSQESHSRARIPRGFADTLGCSSMAREKAGAELKLRYYSSG